MKINNEIYDVLGERWYTAYDDPVALLRAESKLRNPWVEERIRFYLGEGSKEILDVGCGAGFLANELSLAGHRVTGLDISRESLRVAKEYDISKRVHYLQGSAYTLPCEDASLDVVCAMDFLEHVEDPARVVHEISRVLRPEGLFFFHTFNRNPLSWLLVIKAVEWFVRNTPQHMHVYDLFVKPSELRNYCNEAGLLVKEMHGTKPLLFRRNTLQGLFTRTVPRDFRFDFTHSLWLGYSGIAQKLVPMVDQRDGTRT